MGRRGKYEFNRRTKDEIYRRQRQNFPENVILEVDHIVSVRECKEKGIPSFIASSVLNAQLLTRKDNREKSDSNADPIFVDYLLSLIVRMI